MRKGLLKKAASNLLAFLLLPIVLLVALEGVARLIAPDDMTLRDAREELIDWRDGAFPYVLRAGYRGQVWQRDVRINSVHLRSPELDARPDTGADTTTRVLLIGDSVIFGIGLADDQAPAAVLEASLGSRYQVLNGGVPGYSTEHALAFLTQFGDTLRPDAVVLGYCLNDPVPGDRETMVRVQKTQQKVNWFAQANLWLRGQSFLYLHLKDVFNVYRARHDFMKAYMPLYNDVSWERNRAALLEIDQWTRARGIPFLLMVFPHRDQLIDTVPTDERPQRLMADLSREAGFSMLDLRPALAPEDFIPNDALHLDARGMQKSMQALARFFQEDAPSTQLTSAR